MVTDEIDFDVERYSEKYIENLRDTISTLTTTTVSQEAELKLLRIQYEILEEKYKLAVYKRFVKSSEQIDAKQNPLLFTEDEIKNGPEKEAEEQEKETIRSYERNKKSAGRKPIDENIPRETEVFDIPEAQKTCSCGAALIRIGEDVSEQLEIVDPRI
jgi:hypothetical protein